jgi:hypothetical protein
MPALAVAALRAGRPAAGWAPAWYRDAAVLVLCLVGCAVVAFVPPAYFDGISTTRHMVGMNLATMLAAVAAVALAISLACQAVTQGRRPPAAVVPPVAAPAGAVSPAPPR